MKQKVKTGKSSSGSGLIFAVILLFVILAMVVTLSSITVLETKMSQKTKSSVGAFYNSESGVEWALNKIATSTDSTITGTFNNDSNVYDGVDCPSAIGGSNVCKLYLLKSDGTTITASDANNISLVKAIRSIGTQNTGEVTQRAIEAAVASGGDYQTSCSDVPTSPNPSFACCKIKISTGETKCRYSDNFGVAWKNIVDPWGATSGNQYQISCSYIYNALTCCRTDSISGTYTCKYTSDFSKDWLNVVDP